MLVHLSLRSGAVLRFSRVDRCATILVRSPDSDKIPTVIIIVYSNPFPQKWYRYLLTGSYKNKLVLYSRGGGVLRCFCLHVQYGKSCGE